MDTNQALSASVKSIISQQPVLFVQGDKINVAVLGIVMPFRVFMMMMISRLYGVNPISMNPDLKRNQWLHHEMTLMQSGIKVPERFAAGWLKAPWIGACEAVDALFVEYRSSSDKAQKIMDMITEMQEAHEEIYKEIEPIPLPEVVSLAQQCCEPSSLPVVLER